MYQLKTIIIISSILITNLSIGQGEANKWYFGQNAGVDFNTTPPSPLLDGALNSQEGCASICDKNGELLFYTNGEKVWNKNHVIMPNGSGLFGHYSSVQSAIVVPYPGTYNSIAKRFNKYFIVTVDEVYNDYYVSGPQHGVSYSEVDMTLNGGLGDITANKNIHLFDTSTTEKICVVQHSNNCDYWVIGKPTNNIDYYAYAITSSGVNPTPVISSAGPIMGNYIGSLKASPNGKLIAATHGGNPGAPGGPASGIPANDNGIFVYNFDNTNGILTFKFFDTSVSGYSFTYPFPSASYSLEFSPDSKVLYHSINNNPNIFQYNPTATTQLNFISSRQIIGTTSNSGYYAKVASLQLAPDGKIYAALRNQPFLGVINNPNILGINCNYIDMQLGLGGRICQLGLPTIVTNLIRPTNKIIMTDSCPKNQIQFSLLDTARIESYSWNFAHLATPNSLIGISVLFNPTMQVQAPGDYLITCAVNYGCYIDTLRDTFNILQPAANFSFMSGCAGTTVAFSDNSSIYNASITSHTWDFGDGSPISSIQNPSHTYTSAGTYFAKLIVTISNGCVDSLVKSVTVNPKPNANFGSTIGCPNSAVAFFDSTTTAAGIINLWDWSFGDNSQGDTTQHPTHLYTSAGNFSATLIVQTSYGCADTITKPVIFSPDLAANFTFDDACLNDSVLFSDSSITAGNAFITGFSWDFGDGTPGSNLQNPHHYYTSAGTYTTSFTVTNNFGCTNQVSKSVQIYSLPSAYFGNITDCQDIAIPFSDGSFTNMGTINSWNWNFGDNSPTATTQNAIHNYTSVGTYYTTLIVTTNVGCIDSITRPVVIHPNPIVNFIVSDTIGCEPLCVTFDNTSTISTGSISSWNWTLGDNTNNTSQSFAHCFSNNSLYMPNQYSISLQVTSENGCSTLLTKDNYITVYPKPVAAFTVEPTSTTINNPLININEQSTGADAWNWDFDVNNFSTEQEPHTHTYTDTGVYTIQLIVSTNYNCSDTSYNTIIIEPDFTFYVPSAFSPNDDGINDDFIGKGSAIKDFQMLIFDRWGELIYETNDITKPWNGKIKNHNKIVQSDVYIYSITVTSYKNITHHYRGTVTVTQ